MESKELGSKVHREIRDSVVFFGGWRECYPYIYRHLLDSRVEIIGLSHKWYGEDVFAFLGQSRLCPYTKHPLFSPQ